MAAPDTPPTLIAALQALEEHAYPEPMVTGLGVYDRRGKDLERRPYPELVLRARAWGAWLRERGVQPGDVVYLCLPTSLDLVESFLGAVTIGALPCCLALPRAIGGLDVFHRRLEALAPRYPGGHLITTPEVAAEAGRPAWEVPELDLTRLAPLEAVDAGAMAYVQLTSGSTAIPKAVAIRHSNLCANAHGIYAGGRGTRFDDFVSWLPLYHDMGLVGMLFTALIHGNECVLMRPETFVGSPLRWLQAISAQERNVVSAAPNFGYQWCVDRVKSGKFAGLDLSNWRLAACGAEMVRPETVTGFLERFASCGLRPDVFVPCYGMAETTLAVTFGPIARPPQLHEGRMSCGTPIVGTELQICDPESGDPLPDGQEGEVVTWGSSLFAGYHADETATAATLRGGRLHTGDLGYLWEGELYITGRIKDLIILDGANVAPHELEWIAEQHVELDGGRAAAFSVERDRREVPVLVVEIRELPDAAAIEAIRGQAAADVAPLHDLVFVRRGDLPKTSSGKVMRGQIKQRYLSGALDVLWQLSAATSA